jgi:GntR family transcriptional regulator, transcriptional repressor for pyruvate dehydrogenase complex
LEKKRAELVRALTSMIREPERFPEGRLPPERELAKALGVSRNLLREAIITMEALGLLEMRERMGTFITLDKADNYSASLKFLSLWPEDLLSNLMEMRLVVEVPAAGLAAQRRTGDELARMRDCVRQLEAVQGNPDHGFSSGAVWDTLLHTLVLDAAHNPVLSRVYEGLASTMGKYIDISRGKLLALEGWSAKTLREHSDLVEAIAAKDADAAMAAERRHLEGALFKLNELRASGRDDRKTEPANRKK